MRSPSGFLTESEISAERSAQAFATVHLATAIAGLTLCRAQGATLYGAETLNGFIGQLRDMEACIESWVLKTDEAERTTRHAVAAPPPGTTPTVKMGS
jgi:hypothetical protein